MERNKAIQQTKKMCYKAQRKFIALVYITICLNRKHKTRN